MTTDVDVSVTGEQGVVTLGSVTVTVDVDVSVTGVSAQGQIGNVLIWSPVDDGNTVTWTSVLT